ncbi:hypothetical protein BH10ACI3_BH10ACI3_05000 [soil metagenome]
MNIKPTLNYSADTSIDDLYVVKRANEWISAAQTKPVPKMLFGECWLESELSVLTAPSGMGKSLLAVQIAESIARGLPIEGFSMTAKPQGVLYIDLKLSDKQFEMRYAPEYEPEDGEMLTGHYQFAENFHRVEVDTTCRLPDGYGSFSEALPDIVRTLVSQTDAKAVIIDDVTCVQTSVYGYRETLPLMRALKKLKREMGLSILVLATEAGRDVTRTPTSLRLLDRYADNVFTIGQSTGQTGLHYIKHIRSQSTDVIYDASHVASFSIGRLGGNFLGFRSAGFCEEKTLNKFRVEPNWALIDRIKAMSDDGKSIRQIADECNIPKTNVHRLLQIWDPDAENTGAAVPPQGPTGPNDPKHPYYFPGRDVYEDNIDKVDNRENRCTDERERRNLGREGYLLNCICAEARKIYLATGQAPTFAESVAAHPELKALREANGSENYGKTTETDP